VETDTSNNNIFSYIWFKRTDRYPDLVKKLLLVDAAGLFTLIGNAVNLGLIKHAQAEWISLHFFIHIMHYALANNFNLFGLI